PLPAPHAQKLKRHEPLPPPLAVVAFARPSYSEKVSLRCSFRRFSVTAIDPSTKTRQPVILSGADILVKSLVDQGVEVIFAYPGGASMPLHQALVRYGTQLRTILPRHEQGGCFA